MVDESLQRCRDEDSARYLDAIMERQEEEEIMADLETFENDSDHPIVKASINICALASSIKNAKRIREADIYTLSNSDLSKVMKEIGHANFKGQNKKKMGRLICNYVNDKCGCLGFYI